MRATGATDNQVESAMEALYPEWGYSRAGALQIANIVLGVVVPPTHRVVSVDDLKRLRSLVPNAAPEFLDDALALERIDELVK